MKILSMDPGTKTGLVFWEGPERVHAGAEVHERIWNSWEVRQGTWLDSVEMICDCVISNRIDVLLYENFVLRGGGGHSSEADALDSVRVTSGVLAMLRERGWEGRIVPFDMSIKAVMSDERMKRWKLWLQGGGGGGRGSKSKYAGFEGHATDAARGLAWYLRQGMKLGGSTAGADLDVLSDENIHR